MSTQSPAARAAVSFYYDLIRIEALPHHPALAPESWGQPYDDIVHDLASERIPAFEEDLQRAADDPQTATTSYLDDPEQVILDEIRHTTAQIRDLQERLALQVTYAREFTPDPPRLIDLADAAGVSRTQITRMYDQTHVDLLSNTLNLPSPRNARAALRERDDVPSTMNPAPQD